MNFFGGESGKVKYLQLLVDAAHRQARPGWHVPMAELHRQQSQ